MRHEKFRKFRLAVNGSDHGRLRNASNHAFIDRPCCCDAQRMAIKTPFAKKMIWSQHCHHRFLALLGNDRELDVAFLDVKDRVRILSLCVKAGSSLANCSWRSARGEHPSGGSDAVRPNRPAPRLRKTISPIEHHKAARRGAQPFHPAGLTCDAEGGSSPQA